MGGSSCVVTWKEFFELIIIIIISVSFPLQCLYHFVYSKTMIMRKWTRKANEEWSKIEKRWDREKTIIKKRRRRRKAIRTGRIKEITLRKISEQIPKNFLLSFVTL